jgi:hypothetical protein
MKTKPKQGHRRFQLKVLNYGNSYYIERIARLEAALARRPRQLEIELLGVGEIPADTALLIRSILLERSRRTRLITRARSSLQGATVLVWLLGDERIMREDSRMFFRPASLPDEDEMDWHKVWKYGELKYVDSYSETDPEEADYARVLELINEFLPVKELAGRLIGQPVLRQFGLVENEKLDQFLATAFGKLKEPPGKPVKSPKEKPRRLSENQNAKVLPRSQGKQ